MNTRYSRFFLLAAAVVSLSAYSLAYGRGGGGGHAAGGYEHANARPEESRTQAEDHREPEQNAQGNHQNTAQNNANTNNGREDEGERHTVDNPFVRGAEAKRALNRNGFYGERNPYYWGWGGIGGGDWTTSDGSGAVPATGTP